MHNTTPLLRDRNKSINTQRLITVSSTDLPILHHEAVPARVVRHVLLNQHSVRPMYNYAPLVGVVNGQLPSIGVEVGVLKQMEMHGVPSQRSLLAHRG